MSIPGIDIQQLRSDYIDDGLGLCRIAGWNQIRADWERLLELNPTGCYAAESEGRIIGTVTSTHFGKSLAWIGMMLVHPDFRRRGIASQFIQSCLKHLEQAGIPCARLDATPTGARVYEKLGFVPEWEIRRWQREPRSDDLQPAVNLSSLTSDHLTLDYLAFGADRTELLNRLRSDSHLVRAKAAYGMLRSGHLADYLGPVVAASVDQAAFVIEQLCEVTNRKIFWDVPVPNAAAVSLARSLGFKPCRDLLRMRKGDCANPADVQLQFAIAGPSTG
jgi:GNAT superfamily N-acetyltransferase